MNPLWTPSVSFKAQTRLSAYFDFLHTNNYLSAQTMEEVHTWSLQKPEVFWGSLWNFFNIIGDPGSTVIQDHEDFIQVRFFPEARLNFAENMLRYCSNSSTGDEEALVFWSEDRSRRVVTRRELYDQVVALARFLKSLGVQPGDRVAGVMPNMPETVVAMLAVTSIGAVWSSCSPDFGVSGIVDRLGQIEPRVFLCCDRYPYHGKSCDLHEKNVLVCQEISSIQTVIACSFDPATPYDLPSGTVCSWVRFQDASIMTEALPFIFERFPFDHPLAILFSSGTTGVPKCIVHRAGGVLLEHMKEHQLHSDIRPQDRVFYYSTCGWMMWNWHVSALASGATLLLYDGSPLSPHEGILFEYAEQERMTFLGVSAKYFDTLRKHDFSAHPTYSLPYLRTIASTGSPLSHETFESIYTHIAPHVHLASISGGTDILGCFALGNPHEPVWPGELQALSLGLDVRVYDASGRSDSEQKGELVCCHAFPSMPLCFWNDPENIKYRKAYFGKFPNIWCHGDYVQKTEHGGLIIFGRSDATLNPGGVRIGTSEIYRQVEKIPEILESIVVGQEWDHDVRVILFVKLAPGCTLDAALIEHIKKHIRHHTTPRHVPAKIIAVQQIPRTKSGKLVELAVHQVIHHQPVVNQGSLANPEALLEYENIPDLQGT